MPPFEETDAIDFPVTEPALCRQPPACKGLRGRKWRGDGERSVRTRWEGGGGNKEQQMGSKGEG